jgi:hypothetical protein
MPTKSRPTAPYCAGVIPPVADIVDPQGVERKPHRRIRQREQADEEAGWSLFAPEQVKKRRDGDRAERLLKAEVVPDNAIDVALPQHDVCGNPRVIERDETSKPPEDPAERKAVGDGIERLPPHFCDASTCEDGCRTRDTPEKPAERREAIPEPH